MRDSVSLGFVLLGAATQCSQNTLRLSPKTKSFVFCSSELGYRLLLALICSLKNSGVITLAHWMEKIRALCTLNVQRSRVQPALSRTGIRTERLQGNWVWPVLDGQMLPAVFKHCGCCRHGTRQQLYMSPGPPAALLAPAGNASLRGTFLFSLQGSLLPSLCLARCYFWSLSAHSSITAWYSYPGSDGLPAARALLQAAFFHQFPCSDWEHFAVVGLECQAHSNISLDLIKNLKNESYRVALHGSRVISPGCGVVSCCL